MIAFREHLVRNMDSTLIVGHRRFDCEGNDPPRASARKPQPYQTIALLETIEANRFDAMVGGARRDEEKARAKERVFRTATALVNGSRERSGQSYGTSTTPASHRENTSACSPFPTGPS